MLNSQREQIFKEIWNKCKKIRATKGKDYAGGEDVNANFKRCAAKYGITPELALIIYLDKHLDAVTTYINTGELKGEGIEEKIIDIINYYGILLSIIREK